MGGQKQGWLQQGWPEAWVASSQVAKKGWLGPGGLRPHRVAREPQAKRRAWVLCSEDLPSWRDGREGVTFWLTGRGVVSFPWRCDCLNVGIRGGLLAAILILLQTAFAHFVRDGRQVVNQSCLWAFSFEHCSPPPLLSSRPRDEPTVSRFSFSQLVEMIHTDFGGLLPTRPPS